jgi:hypothetical protein
VADHPIAPFNSAGDQEWRELEHRFQELAGYVRFPPTPDLASATRRLLAGQPARAVAPAPVRPTGWRPRLAIAAVLLILLVASVLAISSPARDAVARWLDIPGIRLLFDEDDGSPDGPEGAVRSWLGTLTPLESMQDQVPFPIAVPQADSLAMPDESYLLVDAGAPLVSLIYLENADRPAVPGSDVGVLIMQFAGDSDTVWMQKQLLEEGTRMEVVRMNGIEALWIEGAHKLTLLPDAASTPATRSAGNVLLWNRNGVTYRIESALPMASVIAIAETMRPLAP